VTDGQQNAGAAQRARYGAGVTDVSAVVVCVDCEVVWPVDADVAKCADPQHRHRQHEVHRHRALVILPEGTELIAVSFDEADPYTREHPPDFGVYLDGRWQPPWPHEHVDWPDFGLPHDAAALFLILGDASSRARAGDRVEVGCLGGHGRTGTALACLAVLCGHPPADAVAWVRANYCAQAVETDEQAAFVAALPR
jgi:hypothetical protein